MFYFFKKTKEFNGIEYMYDILQKNSGISQNSEIGPDSMQRLLSRKYAKIIKNKK